MRAPPLNLLKLPHARVSTIQIFDFFLHDFYFQISLGSSDTLSIWIDKAQPQLMGHVFVTPVDETAYMAMLW